jgi:hypothetical protein
MTNQATLDDPRTHAGEATTERHPNRPRYDDVNTPVIVLIGVISAVVTLVTIWAIEGLYYQWRSEMVRERNYDVTNPRQVDLINAQKAKLLGDPGQQIEPLDAVIPDVIDRYKIEPNGESPAESGNQGDVEEASGEASDEASGEAPNGENNNSGGAGD